MLPYAPIVSRMSEQVAFPRETRVLWRLIRVWEECRTFLELIFAIFGTSRSERLERRTSCIHLISLMWLEREREIGRCNCFFFYL